MASFTLRVVLYNAEWEDYEELYEYMKDEGFEKTITSEDGTTYKLPDAEYDYKGGITRSQVLEKLKSAASMTEKKYSVLITESAGRTWYNLEKA